MSYQSCIKDSVALMAAYLSKCKTKMYLKKTARGYKIFVYFRHTM